MMPYPIRISIFTQGPQCNLLPFFTYQVVEKSFIPISMKVSLHILRWRYPPKILFYTILRNGLVCLLTPSVKWALRKCFWALQENYEQSKNIFGS